MADALVFLGWAGDLVVAAILLGVLVLVFMGSRTGVLPRASLPLAIGAAAATFGVRILGRRMMDEYAREAKRLKADIAAREERIEGLTKRQAAAGQEWQVARADFDRQLDELQRRVLEYEARDADRRAEIRGLPDDEVSTRFDAAVARLGLGRGGP